MTEWEMYQLYSYKYQMIQENESKSSYKNGVNKKNL